MAENVKQDTTLEVVAVAAISTATMVLSTGGDIVAGVALGIIGIACLGLKYWAR